MNNNDASDATDRSAAGRQRPSDALLILNLVAQMAYGLLAMTITLPSMPEWGPLFGADAASVQLTFGGYVVAYGGLQLIHGPLSDRHGRRQVLVAGLALGGAASLAAVFADTLAELVAARIVQGAGCAACMVVGRASVQDFFDGAERTRVMAYVGMAMGVVPPLATVIGGQLHVRLGWQANFVLLAGLALLLIAMAWRLPARPAAARRASDAHDGAGAHWLRTMGRAYGRLLREPAFVLPTVIISTAAAAFYAFLGAAPLVLHSYGVGPDGVGWYMMISPLSYIVGNFLASRLVHRIGDQRLMAIGEALSLASIAIVIALAGWLPTPLAFALPLVLLGIGHGFLIPPALAASVGVMPALAGSAAALGGLVQQFTGALGSYAVGWVSHDGPLQTALVMMAFMLLAGAALWGLRRRARTAPPAAAEQIGDAR